MDATEERWLPVVGWEHRYEVSNLGRVRTIPHTHPRTILAANHAAPNQSTNWKGIQASWFVW